MDEEEASKQTSCVEIETSSAENGDVQVYYLDVPDSEDGHVLDISNITNILSQEGIQIVETDSGLTECVPADSQSRTFPQNVILEVEADGSISTDQSATQSAQALLNLSKAHSQSQQTAAEIKVDILDVNVNTPVEGDLVETEQVQISEPVTATYVLDENGTMVPLTEYRETHGSSFLEVQEPSAQTVAACACWCGKEFYSQEELDKHKLNHSKRRMRGSAQLKCQLCNQVFNTSSKLASHHRVVHPDGMPWECPICFRRFSKKLGLKVHLRAHSGLKQHKCSYCDRSFSYKNALLRHIRLHTKDKPYKCNVCGEVFAHMLALRRHKAIHKPKHLFQCDICSKTFKQKTTLFIHARVHTGHKPYTCEICRKSFTLKCSLNQHLRIHTGERPKICPICNRAFRQTTTLKSHIRLHNHVKPHKCRYCKKRFAVQDEMWEHEKIHLSNKSWECENCGMRFRNQSLLARHMRKHTNERPFQCKICGKSFCQSGSLQSHMRTHTKEKPYQCRLCPKSYTTSGTLLLHIRRTHNLDAKSVKDVFPTTHNVEDQKVFTIPTPALQALRNNTAMNTPTVDEYANENAVSEVLERDGLVFEEVVGSSQEEGVTSEDGRIIIQRINPFTKESSEPSQTEADEEILSDTNEGKEEDVEEGSQGDSEIETKQKKKCSSGSRNKNLNVKDLMRKRHIKPGSLTLMNVDSGQYKIIDMEKENSLYAQARQEAALGLAELSLVGGVVVSEKKSGTAYRTVARGSDAEALDDPSVTKIILSKEGGVMNSQDPHQCPECKRIFGRKSIMVEHRRIHTDEKPYKCDFCPGKFRQSAQLTCHILNKHTKERLYHCTFCQKKFLSRSITVRHINFHHKLKLRMCQGTCPGWTVDDAIFVEKQELVEASLADTGTSIQKDENRCKVKFGRKSNITILNSLASLGSPTVKVKFGTDKKKVALKSLNNKELADESHTDQSVLDKDLVNLQTPVIKKELTEEESEELDHEDDAVIGTWYVCETCAMQFNSMDNLRWHLRQVHNTTLAESDVSYVFEDEPAGNVTKELGVSGTDDTIGPVEESVVEEDVEEVPKKPIMNGKQEERTNYVVVAQGVNSKSSNVGETQDSMFNVKATLRCSICSIYYGSRIELEQHMMNHSSEEVEMAGLHRCDTCGVVMKNTQQITRHILKVHGAENVFGCSICDKEFFQESSVLRHMKFFHKWEMKIRGEGNIPVLLKPASEHLKVPGAGDKDKVKGKVKEIREDVSPSKKNMKTDVKVTSRYENDMTFISLEVGDLDHLQLYREDGQEVKFEVVSSTEKATVIRIKDSQKDHDGDSSSVIGEVTDKSKVEKVTAEIIHTGEDSVFPKTCEDPKVSVMESPSKTVVVVNQDEVMETEEAPNVIVETEEELSSFHEDSMEVVEEKSNGTVVDVQPSNVCNEDVENEKGERKVAKDSSLELNHELTVTKRISKTTEEVRGGKVSNSSEKISISNSNSSKSKTTAGEVSNLEVRVIEKTKGGKESSSNEGKTSVLLKPSACNPKVRTISVLDKSPPHSTSSSNNDKKASPIKRAVVCVEKVNSNTINYLKSEKFESTCSKLNQDKGNVQKLTQNTKLKRGRPSKKSSSTAVPVKDFDLDKGSPTSVTTPSKAETIGRLKSELVSTTPKTNKKDPPVSHSSSGRLIKRKRFADE